jgi:hypothetical protein
MNNQAIVLNAFFGRSVAGKHLILIQVSIPPVQTTPYPPEQMV